MDKILGVIGSMPDTAIRDDDDISDKLSRRYTTAILVVFAIIVSTKQYVGDPISCWVPAHFTGNHETYANDYCWVKNTYYLPYEEYVPREQDPHTGLMIPYYQWVPIIMLVQSLLFYLPFLLWRTFNVRSGIDVNSVVAAGKTFTNTDEEGNRLKTLEYMTLQLDRYLRNQSSLRTACTISIKHIFSRTICFLCGRRRGNYLVTLYMAIKMLYIINVLGQLFALNYFLGTAFHFYGIDVIWAAMQGIDWTTSPRFPRVTMCDFKVRRLGNVQRYSVMCVLPINLFNEKIFLFVWFWMVLVAVLSCWFLLIWLFRVSIRRDRFRYVKKHLYFMNKLETAERKEDAIRFNNEYLRQDGFFIVRLVGHNTNAITATELVCSLFDCYRKNHLNRDEPDNVQKNA